MRAPDAKASVTAPRASSIDSSDVDGNGRLASARRYTFTRPHVGVPPPSVPSPCSGGRTTRTSPARRRRRQRATLGEDLHVLERARELCRALRLVTLTRRSVWKHGV